METNAPAASPVAYADTIAVLPTDHSRHQSQLTNQSHHYRRYKPQRTKGRQSEADVDQGKPGPNRTKRYKHKSQNSGNKPKISNPHAFKKRGTCFVCGKPGHHAPQCRKRVKTGNNENPPKANLVEGDDIIAVVISQSNMVTNSKNWVVDSGTTRHICANKDAFTSYTPVGDDEKVVYLGDSHTAQVLGKGKVMLKLTLVKTLALNNVLHVPNISVKPQIPGVR